MKRPNIVVFFSDQQRWDTCGCYGQPLDITPNLDAMAAGGVRFANTFTCQPVCGPARAALQTGKYPTEVKCHTNHRMLPKDEMTLAKYLSNAGYDTAYIGKWHLASFGPKGGADDFRQRGVPADRRGGYGFWLAADALETSSHSYDGHMWDNDCQQRDFTPGRYRADVETDWVIEYLESRQARDKPFLLFVSYIEPHHQNDHRHYEGPKGSKERYKDYNVPGDLQGLKGDWPEEFPDYLGCCRSLDANLGRIRAQLEKQGLTDTTLVIYTSDHGSHFRTRNGEYKRSCHEGCIRTPLVMYGPGFTGGLVPEELVSLSDLTPTILTAAGVPVPDHMRGRQLQDLLAGAADWPKEVFLQISESQCGRGVRTSKWKYSVRAPEKGGQDPDSEVYVEDFLYDLEADPHEHNNLVTDPGLASVRAELAQVLKRRMQEVGEAEPKILPKSGK